jgi:hypothetical protein
MKNKTLYKEKKGIIQESYIQIVRVLSGDVYIYIYIYIYIYSLLNKLQ